jgi:hypothetical protein
MSMLQSLSIEAHEYKHTRSQVDSAPGPYLTWASGPRRQVFCERCLSIRRVSLAEELVRQIRAGRPA